MKFPVTLKKKIGDDVYLQNLFGFVSLGQLGLAENYCKRCQTALAGVAHWIACRPANQGVTSLIPSQGTCLGCRPGPQ